MSQLLPHLSMDFLGIERSYCSSQLRIGELVLLPYLSTSASCSERLALLPNPAYEDLRPRLGPPDHRILTRPPPWLDKTNVETWGAQLARHTFTPTLFPAPSNCPPSFFSFYKDLVTLNPSDSQKPKVRCLFLEFVQPGSMCD